jgi:hypothetical protein
VDLQIHTLQTQIANLPAGTTYTAGTGISLSANVITNTAAAPTVVIGGVDPQNCGIVFYIDATGQHGYSVSKGTLDQASNASYVAAGAAITTYNSSGTGCTNWQLPSLYQLKLLFLVETELVDFCGGTANICNNIGSYWSSTEYSAGSDAWFYVFTSGYQNNDYESIGSESVRAVWVFKHKISKKLAANSCQLLLKPILCSNFPFLIS